MTNQLSTQKIRTRISRLRRGATHTASPPHTQGGGFVWYQSCRARRRHAKQRRVRNRLGKHHDACHQAGGGVTGHLCPGVRRPPPENGQVVGCAPATARPQRERRSHGRHSRRARVVLVAGRRRIRTQERGTQAHGLVAQPTSGRRRIGHFARAKF